MILKLREIPNLHSFGTKGDKTRDARQATEKGKLIRGTFTRKSMFTTTMTKKKISLNFNRLKITEFF